MKFSAIVLIALITLPGIFSCSKNNDSKPKTSAGIEGRWEGTYVNDASGDNFYYSFNIKAGGVIEELSASGEKLGEGTWTLDNNILSAHYTWPGGSKYSVVAAYYKDQNKLLGDWGYDNSNTDGGTWEMHKVN